MHCHNTRFRHKRPLGQRQSAKGTQWRFQSNPIEQAFSQGQSSIKKFKNVQECSKTLVHPPRYTATQAKTASILRYPARKRRKLRGRGHTVSFPNAPQLSLTLGSSATTGCTSKGRATGVASGLVSKGISIKNLGVIAASCNHCFICGFLLSTYPKLGSKRIPRRASGRLEKKYGRFARTCFLNP